MRKSPLFDDELVTNPYTRLTNLPEADDIDIINCYSAFKDCSDEHGIPIPSLERMLEIIHEQKELSKKDKTRLRRKRELKNNRSPKRKPPRDKGHF
jgi:hypothetical protein